MEDARIVDLYWQRSEEAIPQTALKFGRYCHKVAYNILSCEQDAEECVNDTYLAAWNSMPTNRPAVLSPYLGRITRNLALTRVAARSAQKRGGGEMALALAELADCLAGGEDPQQAAERREVTECIERFLRALPETQRQIFVCRYWYLTPVGEIAQRFGYTESKTASVLYRLRIRLHTALEKEGLL